MSYNREWDRGKATWGDEPNWPNQDGREGVREREDDMYGDGKRRKFNNGVRGHLCQAFSGSPHPKGYDGSRNYDANSYNDNRQNEWLQDNAQDERSRGGGAGFPKKRLVPSEPSPHVIFLGLDPDFTEADVCRLPCS